MYAGSSTAIPEELPTPGEAHVSLPGLAFALAISPAMLSINNHIFRKAKFRDFKITPLLFVDCQNSRRNKNW
jgi:hypothetical protein